jgi:putative protein kinase ArgK-like GTPase of G3E family
VQVALRGKRQIVFITGEPGIGKTALVDEFQRRAAAELHPLEEGYPLTRIISTNKDGR